MCDHAVCILIDSLTQLGELSEAEDALAEANVLNNTDPEVWAYLSLVCLKTGRELEAEQAYKYAIKVSEATHTCKYSRISPSLRLP